LSAVAAACGAALLVGPGGVEQPASPEPGRAGPRVPASTDVRRRLADTARVAFAALAIAGGVDLMVHGVLAV
ncbi:MAG: hypothetical protein ACLFXM_14680, partial [Acidimicrobiia bacterium]